jgi:curved DNA-binding protein CbpA
MAPNPEPRRHPRTKSFPGQRDLTIIYQTETGPSVMAAKLLDFSDRGMKVELPSMLSAESSVEVIGDIEGAASAQPLRRLGSVRWCSETGNGRFVAGLSIQFVADGSGPGEAAKESEATDYYEILQLSRNANPDTIQRMFHILAKRYHPDNKETGNAELFREVAKAAHVLTDPQLRAAHDARLGAQSRNRFKIIEASQTSQTSQTSLTSRGVEAEKLKRKGILALLYGRRFTDSQHPSLGLLDLEQMLDCPREQLEFTLWFLKESKWIKSGDNARYEITLQGVLIAEEEKMYPLRPPALQLSAAKHEEKS